MSKRKTFEDGLLGIQNNMFSFALKLTTDRDEAHDLVQDTTLKALDNEDKYVENSNLKGWVFTIMRNIFINNYRRSVSRPVVADSSADDAAGYTVAIETGVETTESAFSASEISQVIAKFPPEYSRPFIMHVAGYKYEEIAEMLDTPLGTVKSRIFATRQKLREILKDYR